MTMRSARRRARRCTRPAVSRRLEATASASCCCALCLAMPRHGQVSGRLCSMMHELAAELPVEGMRLVLVPVSDETVDALDERRLAGKVSPTEYPTLHDPEPDFDLVDPRGVLRGVHEVEAAAMRRVELLPRLAKVDVEVVPDDMDVPGGVLTGDGLHE